MFAASAAFVIGFGSAWALNSWRSHRRKAALRNFRRAYEPGPRT